MMRKRENEKTGEKESESLRGKEKERDRRAKRN
jgi:hypothetical protein